MAKPIFDGMMGGCLITPWNCDSFGRPESDQVAFVNRAKHNTAICRPFCRVGIKAKRVYSPP
jgi:hypothetical protein